MDTYIQNLFSKDDIGFKPVNNVKDSTKIFVFRLNRFIKDRDGKNITQAEIIRLAEEINLLGEKIKAKMKSVLKVKSKNKVKEPKKSNSLIGQDISNVKMIDSEKDQNNLVSKEPEQTGGNIEYSVPEISTIDLLNSVNNTPCSGSITQCGDFVTSCGQSGGGAIVDKNYELFENTLNNFKQFNISGNNKKILYDFVQIYNSN